MAQVRWTHLAALLLIVGSAPLSAQEQFDSYPAARMGGNYMHNFYFPPAVNSAPWAPSWAPDGESVVVSMHGSIWSVNVDSGLAVELVSGPAYYSSPNYSPDGRWLIYTADDHGRSIGLEILDLETGETHALTDDEEIYMDPSFSPDGTRVVYVSTEPTGYFNVFVRDFAEGQWTAEGVAVTADNSFGKDRLYFGSEDIHINPTWFPNNEELLLVSNRDVALGSGNVFRVPARADGFEDRAQVLAEQTLYRTQPDVSIDGKRFIFSSTRGTADQFNNLYVQPTVGGEPYKMTFFQHDAFHPRWSPDGEWIAFIDNNGVNGLPRLRLLETYGGQLVDVEITGRRWLNQMGRLSMTTLGADGQPTGTRVHVTAANGKFYAPDDQYARMPERARVGAFHHEGSFEIELPVGETELVIVKGFEHTPVERTVSIESGQTLELTVQLEQLVDMSANGWHNGSTHVHANYAGNLHNTLENLMMMSEAEDQDIVLEQIANKDNRILDYQYFVPGGGEHPLSTDDMVLVVGQEYRPPFYGHVFMFGMQEHLISPFTTGYEGTGIESLYPSNTDMFRKAKRQGAWTGYVHSFFSGDPLEGNLGGAKGFIVDAALMTADAVEWSTSQDGWPPLYAAWSNGLKPSLVGGEDSISSLHTTPLVGSVRTYVYIPDDELTMRGWLDGMKNGHAFMSNGPLVEFDVGGRIPGETVSISEGQDVVASLEVMSITPLERAEIVFNGEVIASIPFTGDRKSLSFERSFRPNESGWYHVRVNGAEGESFPLDIAWVQAATNPVWVEIDGAPVRSVDAADYALAWIDKLQEMAEEWSYWRSDAEQAHVYGQFEEARDVYRARRAEAEGR
ncbi:MAG: CehA/McbA family metallohydrolase [Longimicrobiales bacterium]|nr:CehA/McbA family metallohydrolase [Longimicrobiales bacterium]